MTPARFWAHQALRLFVLIMVVGGAAWAWSATGHEIGPAAAWLAAGVAVASQRIITAFAGYLILLRGKVFTLGDRITMGGVRGDVVALGFMQTTVMEMGQTPAEQGDDPSMWIRGRQYSGRIVRVTNDRIFDTPVYNYTRDFPFMWEEIVIPVRYGDDHGRVESIMLEAARRHTEAVTSEARHVLPRLEAKYFAKEQPTVEPRVYLRLTDNWIELAVRYLAPSRGSRDVSDAINREVLSRLNAAGIPIASSTQTVTVVPDTSEA